MIFGGHLILILALGCNLDYAITDTKEPVHEVDVDTAIITEESDAPLNTMDSDSVDAPQDDPVLPTDSDTYPETPVLETDVPADTDHPTMDEFGNPLYPIINPDFEDTGVAPDPSVSRSLEDCNIPDDFMLVTYVDFDQDGFGADPYETQLWGGMGWLPTQIVVSGISSHYNYFMDREAQIYDIDAVNPRLRNETPNIVSPQAVSLFPEIYQSAFGIERLHTAIDIINNEGGLGYTLTAQAAITNQRNVFRNALVFIAQQRCANSMSCLSTNFESFPFNGYNQSGFYQNTFLTYFLWQGGGGCANVNCYGSPFSATFWKGDEGVEYGFQYYSRNDQRYFTFDRLYDTDPNVNEGFYVCSWFSDDADGDGYSLEQGDCNDGAAWISPVAREIPNNGVDNNCDGLEDCFSDNDRDGYYGLEIHTVPTVDCPLQGRPNDCNDSDARINPGLVEIPCNHIDENCDSTDMN